MPGRHGQHEETADEDQARVAEDRLRKAFPKSARIGRSGPGIGLQVDIGILADAERPEHVAAEARSNAGAAVTQASKATTSDRAIVGPPERYLPKSAKIIAPRPRIVVIALPVKAWPVCESASRIASSADRPLQL